MTDQNTSDTTDDVPLNRTADLADELGWRFFALPLFSAEAAELIPPPTKGTASDADLERRKHEWKEWKTGLDEAHATYVRHRNSQHGTGRRRAEIIDVRGKVRYTLGDCTGGREVRKGMSLPDGAHLITGPKSQVRIRYPDKTETRVGSRTSLQLHEQTEDRRNFFEKVWDAITQREEKKVPSNPIAEIGSVPNEDFRVSVVRPADAHRPILELSGTTLESARPISPGEFYEGQLGPNGRAFGKLHLDKGHAVKFRVYMQKAWEANDYQPISFQVADSYGGVIEREITTTNRTEGDVFDIWSVGFTAPSAGDYFIRFQVEKSNACTPLNLRVLAEL